MIDLGKQQDLTTLNGTVSWEQPKQGGLRGAVMNKLNQTDVDLVTFAFVGTGMVDYVDPKSHPSAMEGRLYSTGDVKKGNGGDGETVVMKLAELGDEITALALALTCTTGSFDKITGTKVIFTDQNGNQVGLQRFSVTTTQNAAVIGVVKRTPTGWVFNGDRPRYGQIDMAQKANGQAWRALAQIATDLVR